MDTVTVRTFDNYFQANLVMLRLQDAGLECWLKDEYTVTLDPLLTNAVGGIKLVVKDSDAPLALNMIAQIEEEYRNNAVCPRCNTPGLNYISKPGAKNILTAVLAWLFGDYALTTEKVYQCAKCGWEGKDLPEINTEKEQ